MTAAKGIIKDRHRAERGVSQGKMLAAVGKINATDPAISEMPMNFMKAGCSPSTPVWPIVINLISGNIDLHIPEYRNIMALTICKTQIIVFIIVYYHFHFEITKVGITGENLFDICQKIKAWPVFCLRFPVLYQGRMQSCLTVHAV